MSDGDRRAHWRLLDAAEVADWDVKPLEWLIEPIVAADSLTLCAGPSQVGKSLLWIYICRVLAGDGVKPLFGRFAVKAGLKVLYLALEDPAHRIRARLLDSEHGPIPETGRLLFQLAPGLNLGNPEDLDHLESLIEHEGYDFVVLDTYQKATPGLSSFDDERQSPILHQLADVTRSFGVAIVVLDHTRKASTRTRKGRISLEDIKGTGAKAANADGVILMERNGSELAVRVSNKDADAPLGFLLAVGAQGERPKYRYLGEMEERASSQSEIGRGNRRCVLQAMEPGEWKSAADLEKTTGLAQSTIRGHLGSLADDGQLERQGEGRWRKYRRPIADTNGNHFSDRFGNDGESTAYNAKLASQR